MGPFVIIVPLALAAVGLAAAASKKKTGSSAASQAAAGAAANAAANAVTPGPGTTGAPMPTDVVAMVRAAVDSGNPETMRRVANALRTSYPAQATFLDEFATSLEPTLAQWGATTLPEAQKKETAQIALATAQATAQQAIAAGATPVQAVQAAQAAATSISTAPPANLPPPLPAQPSTLSPAQQAANAAQLPQPLAPPSSTAIATAMAVPVQALQAAQAAGTAAIAAGATPTQAILAAQNAAVMTATPGVAAAVAAIAATVPRPEAAPVPMPQVQAQPLANAAGKALAADMAKALRTAKKGTASEPRALVQAFQTQERLEQNEGSYGFETALALADRYGIVPPKPLYWGKKGGPPSLPAQQKATYSAHLMVLKSQDPQRADEWQAASKV